ncbi:molybdopterin-dependent oxidoreductase [Thermodesulfobacteriota bacterium]
MAGKEEVIRTVCRVEDGVNCGILAHVKDGKLLKVEPADFPRPGMRHICMKGLSTIKDLVYHPDRLKYPLKRDGERGAGQWKRISWDEAFDIIAENLKDISAKYGSESIVIAPGQIGTSAMMSIYLRLASALQASWVSLAGYGDAAGPGADMLSYGLPYGGHFTTDLPDAKYCIIWGGNYTETQPLTWRRIRNHKERGGKLVVVDPRFTSTAAKADEYLMPRPGTDTALVWGMIKVILDKGLIDESFINQYTVGPMLVREDNGLFLRGKDLSSNASERVLVWDSLTNGPKPLDEAGIAPVLKGSFQVNGTACRTAFQVLADTAAQYPLDQVSETTEVPPDAIERVAIGYATEKPAVFYRGWGMQRTFYGELAWRAATIMAAITGNIKLDGYRNFMLNRREFSKVPNRKFKRLALLQMYETILTQKPYPVKALWIAANNFINQIPDFNKVVNEFIPRLDFIVTVDHFMTTSAEYSDLVLPAASFYESADLLPPFDTVNPFMQIQQKVIEPQYESMSHVDIVNNVGAKMGFEEHFCRSAEEYMELLLSSEHPSVKGITLEKLKETPVELPEYDVPVLFNTPSGRIEFYNESMKTYGHELPGYIEPKESVRQPLAGKYPLVCINGHTRYLKSSTFANSPLMRELEPEPNLEMNPADAESRGINDGDLVVVFNDRGKVELKAKIHLGIGSGVVNLNQGWWPQNYAAGSHQELTNSEINPAQVVAFEPNAALNDNLVEVKKLEEE